MGTQGGDSGLPVFPAAFLCPEDACTFFDGSLSSTSMYQLTGVAAVLEKYLVFFRQVEKELMIVTS